MLEFLFKKKPISTSEPDTNTPVEDNREISEPVWAIVNALKERPMTFKVSGDDESEHVILVVRDSQTGLVAKYGRLGGMWPFMSLPFDLTADEEKLLIDAGREWFRYSKGRIDNIKRNRWMKRYEQSTGNVTTV